MKSVIRKFDACIFGNGAAALWSAQWLTRQGLSVAWVASENPRASENTLLQHAWLGAVSDQSAHFLENELGFTPSALFDAAYFDAKSSKRLRRLNEVKPEYGAHEKDFFENYAFSNTMDLWNFSIETPNGVEMFFTQNNPVLEIKTSDQNVSAVVLAAREEAIEIQATNFFFADFEDSFASLIKNEEDAKIMSTAMKGKEYLSGFGLHFWHGELTTRVEQTVILPLIGNPSKKEDVSHLAGSFRGDESFWVGFVTADELEDNNEILRKIKLAKRAIERVLVGFNDSIQREAVTFEMRMFATEAQSKGKAKKRQWKALGAYLLSDYFGADTAIEVLSCHIEDLRKKEEWEVRKLLEESEPTLVVN